ncbi:MAG: hypothetical protein Q8S32_17365 [Burkholderiaceae bacterium]|nr:hypothetical protein [Burkholderiaceae bacterium]
MAERPVTDVFDAFRRVVHDYPKGVEKLASRMAMSPAVLYNKANNNESSHHKPTLGDAVLASLATGDHRILHAFASTLGEVCIPLPDLSKVSDTALLELITNIGAESGDFHRAIADGMADRLYRRAEHARVKAEAYSFIAAICESVSRLEGLIDG